MGDDPDKIDDDGDGLIDIWTLAQLNHVRYNLAGTGYRTTALGANEVATPAAGKTYAPGDTAGCPDADHDDDDDTPQKPTCHGYELMNDLDFRDASATGYDEAWADEEDDQSDAGWPPIGDNANAFTGTFDGNHHQIKNLYINLTSSAASVYAGLFGYVGEGGAVWNVGLTGEHTSVKVSASGGFANSYAGGLAGYAYKAEIRNCYSVGDVTNVFAAGNSLFVYSGSLLGQANGATLSHCYATGDVTGRSQYTVSVGGLLGYAEGGTLNNCYATGDVSGTDSYADGVAVAGGLVGDFFRATLNSCYATGDVSADAINAIGERSGGLVGKAAGSRAIAKSYRLSTATVSGGTPNSEGIAKTAAELKALTAASSGWSEKDWQFGSDKDYPALRAYELSGDTQQQGRRLPGQPLGEGDDPEKVDDDEDGLIDIRSLAQLNHMRFNLAGTSYRTRSDDPGSSAGCPSIDHDNDDPDGNGKKADDSPATPKQPTCHGYELVNDLDFTNKSDAGYDADWDPVVQKAKATPGAGWVPVGVDNRFTGDFNGNGHAIHNLYINASGVSYVGLFGRVEGVLIQNLGLTGEHMLVKATVTDNSVFYVGSLAGTFEGRGSSATSIGNCYSTGSVVAHGKAGVANVGGFVGLSGTNALVMDNCYIAGDVSVEMDGGIIYAGGLVGDSYYPRINNCYVLGRVRATGSSVSAGGLLGGGTRESERNSYYAVEFELPEGDNALRLWHAHDAPSAECADRRQLGLERVGVVFWKRVGIASGEDL